ncbi:hypothetical protein O181_119707 [Austropuccinia psidii MF-1]|uniref:Uncharacterized protein n=1 Tax=Austropuccinia psidii MF-1 TaxID=1389203 RepID=A0A9Q3KHS7_9BASI|nr:hypothetical protein [Austropuccinia psidii MF-1]
MLSHAHNYNHQKSTIQQWLQGSKNEFQAIFSEYGGQYSILEGLPYWDSTRMVNVDIMHNIILGALKDYATYKLCIPESSTKKNWPSKAASTESSFDSSSVSLNPSTQRELHALHRDLQQEIENTTPSTSLNPEASPQIPYI